MLKIKIIRDRYYLVETDIEKFNGVVYFRNYHRHFEYKIIHNNMSIQLDPDDITTKRYIHDPFILVGLLTTMTNKQAHNLFAKTNKINLDELIWKEKYPIINWFRKRLDYVPILNNPIPENV